MLRIPIATLVALGAVLVGAALALLGTPKGRDVVAAQLSSVVSDTLNGQLLLGDIAALGPGYLRLEDVLLRTAAGAPLISIQSMEVHFTLAPLLDQQVEVRAVRIEDAFVDLSGGFEEGSPLRKALSPKHPDPTPQSESGSAWTVQVDKAQLDGGQVHLPATWLDGPTEVQDLALRGAVQLSDRVQVELRYLRAQVQRKGKALSERVQVSGHYDSERESAAQLDLTVGPSQLRAEVSAAGPLDRPEQLALKAHVAGDRLAINRIMARLGRPAPLPSGTPPLSTDITYEGSLNRGRGRLRLTSAAGKLQLELRREPSRVEIDSELQRISLRTFAGDAVPPGRLSLSLRAAMQLPDANDRSAGYPIELDLPQGRFGGQPLPRVSLKARLSGAELRELKAVRLRMLGSGLDIQAEGALRLAEEGYPVGRLAIDLSAKELQQLPAAAQYDLQGGMHLTGALALQPEKRLQGEWQVVSERLQAAGLELSSLMASGTVSGPLSRLSGKGRVQLAELAAGDVHVRGLDANVRARKGEITFDGRTRFTLPGNLGGVLKAEAQVRTGDPGTTFEGQVLGTLNDAPLLLRARQGQQRDGRLALGELTLVALGAKMTGQNLALAGRSLKAELTLVEADLSQLSTSLNMIPRVAGKLSGQMRIAGSLSHPTAWVDLEGEGLQRGDAEPVALTLKTALQPAMRSWALTAEIARGDERLLATNLQAALPSRPRGNLARNLLEADYEVNLEAHVNTAEVVEWVPTWTAPAAGAADVLLSLHGPLDDATVDLSGDIALALAADILNKDQEDLSTASAGDAPPAQAQRWHLSFIGKQAPDGGTMKLVGHLGQPPGTKAGGYAQVDLSWEHPTRRWMAALSQPERLLEQASGRAQLRLRSASIAPFGATFHVPESLWPLELSAEGDLSYSQASGPAGTLKLLTRLPRSADLTTDVPPAQPVAQDGEQPTICSAEPMAAEWMLRLNDGQLSLEGLGQVQKRTAVRLHVDADLDLHPQSEQRLEALNYEVAVDALRLRDVPGLCEYGTGELSLNSRGRNLLGAQPKLSAKFHGTQLRSGGSGGLDVDGEVSLSEKSTRLSGHLNHDGRESPFSAVLPIRLQRGQLQVAEKEAIKGRLRIDRLELEPLFGARSPISQARGQVSADMNMSGTFTAPEVEGQIHLQEVAFTASALSQPIAGLTGDVEFDGRTIRIPKLSARDQQGDITLSGKFVLPTERVPQTTVDMELTADEFPVRSQGQVAAEASVAAKLSAVFGDKTRKVNVRLNKADIWLLSDDTRRGLSMSPHPDIVDPEAEAAQRAEAAAQAQAVPLEIDLKATQNFWVKRQDFAVNLDADVQGRIDDGQASMTGEVTVNRGYVQLLGQTFDLQPDGSVSFLGGQAVNPVLDVTAEATARRTSQVVTVNIGGRARSPQLAFQVDGTDATVGDAMMVLLGQTSDNDSEDAQASNLQGQASSFVTGMLGGLLAMTARRELGAAAPILMIDSGQSGGTRVRAGFELDELVPDFLESVVRGVYLEGMVGGGDSQSTGIDTGVLLELYFPYHLIGSGQYGPGNTWSLDLGWDP